MTTFVLVHGAWHGSWCWSRVRKSLTSMGHEVFAPTLTGIGERSHLLDRNVGLETHVLDIANLISWEDLRDVVVVGHSYGGIVIGQAADRMPDRISALVFLDAYVPEDGKSLSDYLPDRGSEARQMANDYGDGWKVPAKKAASFGVNAADVDWVDRKCTMHPLCCFETPARITGAYNIIPNIGYIRAARSSNVLDQFYAQAGERRWWREIVPCGHDVMIDMPDELVALLSRRTSLR